MYDNSLYILYKYWLQFVLLYSVVDVDYNSLNSVHCNLVHCKSVK